MAVKESVVVTDAQWNGSAFRYATSKAELSKLPSLENEVLRRAEQRREATERHYTFYFASQPFTSGVVI